jgi:hypothetical protein
MHLAGSATFPNNFTLEAEGTPLLASLARKPALSQPNEPALSGAEGWDFPPPNSSRSTRGDPSAPFDYKRELKSPNPDGKRKRLRKLRAESLAAPRIIHTHNVTSDLVPALPLERF